MKLKYIILPFMAIILGLAMAIVKADRDEQPIRECPAGHECYWQAWDVTTGKCIKNCGIQEELERDDAPKVTQ